MKFVSWNVNGIRACLTKGFEERFQELDADISACRRRNARRDRSNLSFRAIISTGTTQTEEDIPERQSLRNRSRFRFFMELE
mgnify:CR=1 FL=1